MSSESPKLIALVAGNGSFPKEFCFSAQAQGYQVLCVALGEEADPTLADCANFFYSIKIGEFGKLLKIIKDHHVPQVAFAGGIKKIRLFDGLSLDLSAIAIMAKARTLNDDVILRKIAEEIEKLGASVIPATQFLPNSVPQEGILTKRTPSTQERSDMLFGLPITKGIGALDLGQSIIVHQGLVTAVEAVDGTDATITRGGEVAKTAGRLLPGAGSVLIKLAKPQQDLRFDLPTIGPSTIENCRKSGISAIFLDAGKSLILDRDQTIASANQAQISIEVINTQVAS